MKPRTILAGIVGSVSQCGKALAIPMAFALLGACLAGNSAPKPTNVSKGKTATYFLLVFSNPVAGMEEEYNRWYSHQHQQDVVSIPGFVTAQRFVISDVQLRESKPLRKYLIMYKIVTGDLPTVYAEVNRRIKAGITVMSPAYDRAGSLNFTYRAIRPLVYHKRGAGDAPESGSQVYYQLVFSDPTEGREPEYNKWYDQRHEPEVVSAPGFVEAQRFISSDIQLGNKAPLTKYLVMYKIASNDVAARFADYKRLAPSMVMSVAMGTSYGYTYKAMEPMVMGDQVRAERAKKKPKPGS